MLNDAGAHLLFPNRNPIGQRITEEKTNFEIVGIVPNTKYLTLREAPMPTVYTTITQGTVKDSYTAVLRINGAPGPVIAAARSIVRRIAPEVRPRSLQHGDQIDESSPPNE